MIIKVKYSEISDFTNTINSDSVVIDEEIEKILKNLDKLMDVWQGYDSDQFHEHASSYFNTMKNIPKTMRNITKAIDVAMDGFHNAETSFTQNIRAEDERYAKK